MSFGTLAIVGWTLGSTSVLLALVYLALGLRVSIEDEMTGLDRTEHGVGEDGEQRRVRWAAIRSKWRRRLRLRTRSALTSAAERSRSGSGSRYPGAAEHASARDDERDDDDDALDDYDGPQPGFVMPDITFMAHAFSDRSAKKTIEEGDENVNDESSKEVVSDVDADDDRGDDGHGDDGGDEASKESSKAD